MRIVPATFAVISLILIGCAEEKVPAGPDAPDSPPVEVNGVVARIFTGPFVDGTQIVGVRFDTGEDVQLGSYQARFRFDPQVLGLEEVVLPGDRDFRVVNSEAAAKGEIRFAAFTVERFQNPVALEMRFRTARPIETTSLELAIDVVGTVTGEEVPGEQIKVSRENHREE